MTLTNIVDNPEFLCAEAEPAFEREFRSVMASGQRIQFETPNERPSLFTHRKLLRWGLRNKCFLSLQSAPFTLTLEARNQIHRNRSSGSLWKKAIAPFQSRFFSLCVSRGPNRRFGSGCASSDLTSFDCTVIGSSQD